MSTFISFFIGLGTGMIVFLTIAFITALITRKKVLQKESAKNIDIMECIDCEKDK